MKNAPGMNVAELLHEGIEQDALERSLVFVGMVFGYDYTSYIRKMLL